MPSFLSLLLAADEVKGGLERVVEAKEEGHNSVVEDCFGNAENGN